MRDKIEKLYDIVEVLRLNGVPTLRLDYKLAGYPEFSDLNPQLDVFIGNFRAGNFDLGSRNMSAHHMAIFLVGLATLADAVMLTKIAEDGKWCPELKTLLTKLEREGSTQTP